MWIVAVALYNCTLVCNAVLNGCFFLPGFWLIMTLFSVTALPGISVVLYCAVLQYTSVPASSVSSVSNVFLVCLVCVQCVFYQQPFCLSWPPGSYRQRASILQNKTSLQFLYISLLVFFPRSIFKVSKILSGNLKFIKVLKFSWKPYFLAPT